MTKSIKSTTIIYSDFDGNISCSVMSTFLTDMEQLFRMTLTADGIEGVILNPWNRTLMLDKRFLHIILGE